MVISVFDFYRRGDKELKVNPFINTLNSPIFYILAQVNGRTRELVLKTSGEIKCPKLSSMDFEIEGYRNYLMIVNFLLGEHGELVRKKWGLIKEDFKELIFELYCALIKNHTTCSIFKRAFLYLIGMWKFYIGRKLV